MRVLVLCSGTGSVDRAFESIGWEVVSVDWKKKFRPTICVDLMKWDYKSSYPQDHFSFVWASPQCTMFSVARTSGGPRDIEGATALVKRCMEIAEYFGCAWALENPATGLLKRQPLMQGVPWCDVCYCKYGYDYKKPTRIWHSSGFGACFEPRPTCCKASPCPAVAASNVPGPLKIGLPDASPATTAVAVWRNCIRCLPSFVTTLLRGCASSS